MRNRLMKFAQGLLLLGFIFLLSVSCNKKKSQEVSVDVGHGEKLEFPNAETLRINIASEPPSLDWHRATDTTSSMIDENIMEGLVQYDFKDKELGLQPDLALKWEPSEHARVWKITLRPGVVWNDGVPFTSQHVVDGWKRLLSKETAAEYAYFLFGVKNARAYNEGKKSWDEVGIKANGPLEVDVELEKPMSYFPYLLTHNSTYPIRMDVVSKSGDQWTSPEHIVTLGPFNLKVWQHDKMIVLERNDKYFGDKPSIKNIAVYMIQEQATAINLFDSGKLDSVHHLPSVELRKLRTRPEFKETGILQIYYYGINTDKPPMNNVLVRRAMAMAIDRKELVQMLAGGEIPLSSWIPPGMFGYEPQIGIQFDPHKAKELLAQAGFKDPKTFPKIEIKFNTNEDHQRIAENIQAQLKRNLGINVELKNEEWKVYLNTLKTGPSELFRFGWLADYPDPDNFLSMMASFSENNYTRWKNPKFDELLLKGASETDKVKRREYYAQAQKIMIEDDVAVIPLYASVNHMLVSPRVENYPMSSLDRYDFKGVKLK